jgi:hypothetical protein
MISSYQTIENKACHFLQLQQFMSCPITSLIIGKFCHQPIVNCALLNPVLNIDEKSDTSVIQEI